MKNIFTRDELIGLLAKVYVQDILKGNAVLTRKWLAERWASFNDEVCAKPDGTKGRLTNEAGVEAERILTDIVIAEPAGGVQVTLGHTVVFPAPAPAPPPAPPPPAKKK